MRSAWARKAGMLLALLILAYAPAMALDKLQDGIYAVNPDKPDELLSLNAEPDLRVLILEKIKPKTLSEAHSVALREWVESGGVLWVSGDAVETPLLALVSKGIMFGDFNYKKATTGKQGGELIVRGASDRLVIYDHPLTVGVDELFIQPVRKFDGSKDLMPLVEMTDMAGEKGIVLGAISVKRGYIVLDGTKTPQGMARSAGDFNRDKPHAVKMADDTWNDYDWGKLMENAKAVKGSYPPPKT
ncbi:MAG: hypothetical protein ACREAA_22065 [Candidatus Polarisedimenticolia bacterium]